MQRRTLPLIGAMLAALAAIGLAAVIVWTQIAANTGDRAARNPAEVVVAPGLQVGGDFALVNQAGETVTESDFRGRYMLVYFGYASCPDVCPTELASMAAAVDILAESAPDAAAQVTPVFVTVDPARDTQAVLEDYVAAFHPRMVGLTGSEAAISDIARDYRVYYAKGERVDDAFYLVNHSSYIYLMGPDGDFITMFRGGSAPQALADAMRRYITGGAGATS
jgi:protein SCO1/2